MKDLGGAANFLGMNIERNMEQGETQVNQMEYIKRMLEKFRLQDCNTVSTLADPSMKLDADAKSMNVKDEDMTRIPYQEAVGSLLYLSQVSRPDIAFAVKPTSGGAISWASKRQRTVALSTVETEYIALSSTCQEALWLQQLRGEIEPESAKKAVQIYSDNNGGVLESAL
ncbi:hypothetical protein KPH14_002691 [Odynerus spinipes]|uniref:Uncharacterized protein n=1 Tax=Odynerus spinipes TaxID=1348599 RepID=A0AAD9RG67_9HYME|nr:hypothetical protein KPH14_002691 [Odynerus spinipes]